MVFSSSSSIAIATLTLRILTILALAASIAVIVTDNYSTASDKTKFQDIRTYRFVLSTAVLGCAYNLLQAPFAIYQVSTGKRMIRKDFLPAFDFFGDKIISWLLASGVGAGFAVSFELKKIMPTVYDIIAALLQQNLDDEESRFSKFLDRGNIASGILAFGFIFMAVLSILSSTGKASK